MQARNTGGFGPWSAWATVVTEEEDPPTPTGWDARYSNNKIQVKVTTLPTVTPQITHIGVSLETGQPPNLTTITKRVAASLNEWITVLPSADTGWEQGNWAVHVRFENSVGESSYVLPGIQVTVPAPTPTPPPPPPVEVDCPSPTGITVTKNADTVTISWNAVTDATDYNVEIGIPPSAGGLGETSHITSITSVTIPNLSFSATYRYRVQARKSGMGCDWSAWATVTTGSCTAPTGLGATATSDSITVTWTPFTSEPSYDVEVKEVTLEPNTASTVTEATGSSFTKTGLTASTEYDYRVRVNSTGNNCPWSSWESVTTLATGGNGEDTVTIATSSNTETTYTGCGPTRTRVETTTTTTTTTTTPAGGGDPTVTTSTSPSTETTADPEPERFTWADVVPEETRNRNVREVILSRRKNGDIWEDRVEERTTWDVKQKGTGHCGTIDHRWDGRSSTRTFYRLIREVWGDWEDEGSEVVDTTRRTRTGSKRGIGPDRECQVRVVTRYKQLQERMSDPPYNNTDTRWVRGRTTTTFEWEDCPDVWGSWVKDSSTRRIGGYGSWRRTGGTHYDDIEDVFYYEEERTVFWEVQWTRTTASGSHSESEWRSDGTTTETRWVTN